MRSLPRATALAICLAIITLASALPLACSSPLEPGEKRHIVLVSIDTLRADYLACYGHPYVDTPNIDALAEGGFLFERHITAAPTTLASHTSLMTGTWPHTHGTPRNGFVVSPDNNMLAEVLQAHGFVTAGFIGAFPLSQRFAFNQGFDHWDERLSRAKQAGLLEQSERPANEVTDAALAWAKTHADEQNVFLFVHYFDVHAPYTPPGKYARLYREDDSAVTGSLSDMHQAREELTAGHRSELNELLKQQYAAGVSWVDSELGRLMEGLEDAGILDDAVVVLTSDHGEAMDRHSEYWNHGYTTYHESTRVPLIIRLPVGHPGGRRIDALVSNIDVMPTLLELFSVTQPMGVEGISFAGALSEGEFTPIRDVAYSEATKPFGERHEGDPVWKNARKMRSIETKRWKLVQQPLTFTSEFFDLMADPDEEKDLYTRERDLAMPMQKQLSRWTASARPKQSVPDLDEDTRQRLEALGYGGDAEPAE